MASPAPPHNSPHKHDLFHESSSGPIWISGIEEISPISPIAYPSVNPIARVIENQTTSTRAKDYAVRPPFFKEITQQLQITPTIDEISSS